MNKYNYKSINDPVHGTIGLSELEVKVINTKVFQRLRNVKQLGLANFVFPGAEYTRFSHSIGVCHLAGRILDFLRYDKDCEDIKPEDVQNYRLAGLLHDIGHYPFSHTMEEAIKRHFENCAEEPETRKKLEEDEYISLDYAREKFLDHEAVGGAVLEKDPEIQEIFREYGINPRYIASIFSRNFQSDVKPDAATCLFANLISSDLDADRIDYLLRTSYHAGLPYGKVDINYLLSQIRFDGKKQICLTRKALRTADHFLLSRYFDYSQITYHKTISALEEVLKDVILELIRQGYIDCSADGVTRRILDNRWACFDDSYVFHLIRRLYYEDRIPPVMREKFRSVIERKPAKEISKVEYLAERTPNSVKTFNSNFEFIKRQIPNLAEKYGVQQELWYVWQNRPIEITKIGSSLPDYRIFDGPADSLTLQEQRDKYAQAIRILDPETNSSEPIIAINNSLMKHLANTALYTISVYILFPESLEPNYKMLRSKIKKDLEDSTSVIPWL